MRITISLESAFVHVVEELGRTPARHGGNCSIACARAMGSRGRGLPWRRGTIGTAALTLLHTFLHPQLILLKLLFLVIV